MHENHRKEELFAGARLRLEVDTEYKGAPIVFLCEEMRKASLLMRALWF